MRDKDFGPPCARMTFAWGNTTDILFPGWPGAAPRMYAAALGAVFCAAALVEWCNHGRPAQLARSSSGAALSSGLVHAARVGLSYVLMLAVMSFDVGVLIAAVLGHAVGFLAFGCAGFRSLEPWSTEMKTDVGSMGC
ncbi:copper transporter 6-like [Canna indica]|uniref:Copper transport protein n=1 Tax=Canna indica TaxID=4628 RepID=A0AAQ3JRX9_9LILI|nr:copper transporter 6-like [Canna indica]